MGATRVSPLPDPVIQGSYGTEAQDISPGTATDADHLRHSKFIGLREDKRSETSDKREGLDDRDAHTSWRRAGRGS